MPRPRAWAPALRRHLTTLTGRAVLVTTATAVVSVFVTTLVAVPIAVRSVNAQIRTELMNQTVLAVELLTDERPAVRARIVDRLRAEGVEIYLIRNGRADRAGLPPRVVRRVVAGETVDTRGQVDGRLSFVAARPLPGRAGGVVLTRKVATNLAARVLGGVWVALVIGLAGGVLAGTVLARVVTRPIARAAAAATRLSAGDRSVRISRAGPSEAARLADAFNQLAAALQTSEGRERDFLLSVSHELRTPLATIRGYAEALADGVIAGGDTTGAGATMLGEAQRLDRLISDLLVLSRLEAADLPIDVTEVDLAELVRDAGRAWAARCGADGPALTVETPDGPVLVHTDAGRIRQVIDGLCENALRVVPAGAPLILAARPAGGARSEPAPDRMAPDQAAPGQDVHGGDARGGDGRGGDGRGGDTYGRDVYGREGRLVEGGIVEVRDGGPGFTDDDLAVAFERGELNRRYRGVRAVGSGLGLALAARLVTRLGGRITAGHAPEGGAMFTVELYRSRTMG
ncbi:histidine kinase dimerization/phospho-acceptor domain-containing protein [Actinoplanes sp. NPDC049802]|uniref:sensor histidine kinase n=1 Tax=Actinoplanes sp. NPDC049802 TaxID=3154742 RepID=UPI0033F71068